MMRRTSVAAECTLSQWLQKHADPYALSQGRVFLEEQSRTPRRLGPEHASQWLRVGQVVRVAASTSGVPQRPAPALEILDQDSGLVVLNKPAGVATIPDQHGASRSLLGQLAVHLFVPIDCVHPTSRLDRDVSGVVVFALDASMRHALAEARNLGGYRRSYVALSSGALSPEQVREGAWEARIGRGKTAVTRAVDGPGATHARSQFRHLAKAGALHAWRLEPQTGRTHQLRVHAAHAGFPLIGDAQYGGLQRLAQPDGRVRAPGRVMLHAHRVCALGRIWVAPLPAMFQLLWSEDGGEAFPNPFLDQE